MTAVAEAEEVRRLLAAGVKDPAIAALCASSWAFQQSQRPTRRRYRRREHGSERGYQQHRYDGTEPCQRCLDAHADRNADYDNEHCRRTSA